MMDESTELHDTSMRCIVLTGYGGYNKLSLQKKERPHPSQGEVVVEVKACGMNFSDLCTRQGIYSFRKPPFIMGLECAGVVTEVGEGVQNVKLGDRVMCWSFTYGMWAEYVQIPSNNCHVIPESMSFEEAAAIPVNYLTAYLILFDYGNLRPGQSILIQAAAGGVGWAATQLAKTVENVTIFGTASAAKHDAIKDNGVTYPIDYRTADFVAEVQKQSPKGVDVVIDCLSGADFVRSQQLLKHMGRLVHIGISNMIGGEKRNFLRTLKVWWQTKNVSVLNLIMNNQAICGFSLNTLMQNEPERVITALKEVLNLYEQGKIKPHIDSIWSFEKVADATKHMVNRNNVGKMILQPQKLEENAEVESSEKQENDATVVTAAGDDQTNSVAPDLVADKGAKEASPTSKEPEE